MYTKKHKIQNTIVVVATIFSLLPIWAIQPREAHAFAGGSGTSGDPYQISTPAELASLSSYTGSSLSSTYFILVNDIDLNVAPYNTGSGWTPIGTGSSTGRFNGRLDGNGYEIQNLFINRTSTYQGLFGSSIGNITDVALTNVSVTVTTQSGFTWVGGLVGRNYGTITGSSVSGAVSSSGWYTGGLVGANEGGYGAGSISQSFSTATVGASGPRLGGLVGENDRGSISQSYATGNVTGTSNQVGGLVGIILNDDGTTATASISNSYSRGAVSGNSSVAGFVGTSSSSTTITNSYSTGSVTASGTPYGFTDSSVTVTSSYWDSETALPASTSPKGTAKTTAQMKTQGTFSGWDFSSIWGINGADNDGYPFLLFQGFTPANNDPSTPSSLGATAYVNGSWGADTTPTLSFTLADADVSDTVQYQIQIDNDSDFSSPTVDYTSALAAQGATSFTVGQAAGSGTYNAGSAATVLSEGEWYWRVKAIDNSAAESSYATANSGAVAFRVDSVAPTSVSVIINSGDATTTSDAVTLTLSATDITSGVADMILSEDAGFSGASWEGYDLSKAFTLSGGDGAKTVYAMFRDGAGNVSASTSDTIVLDTAAPMSASVAINSGAAYATSTSANLTLSSTDATSGVADMMLSEDSGFSGASWESYNASKAFSLSSGNGTKTVYAKFRDGAGNVAASTSDTIILDTVAPSGSVVINSGATKTNSRTVTLTIMASDVTSGLSTMRISEDPAFASSITKAYSTTTTFQLSSGAGSKTVYVSFVDVAGNISGSFPATIIYQPTTPSNTPGSTSEDAEQGSSSTVSLTTQYGAVVRSLPETTLASDAKATSSDEEEVVKAVVPSASEGSTVTLRIVDENGDPIIGAQVTLDDSREAITDGDGVVVFTNIVDSSVKVVVNYDGRQQERILDLATDQSSMSETIVFREASERSYLWLWFLIFFALIAIAYMVLKKRKE